jgi:hypothetical protein
MRYIVCASYTDELNLVNCVKIQPNCIAILGNSSVTEIAANGIQNVYNSTTYFRVDPTVSRTTIYNTATDICGTCFNAQTTANCIAGITYMCCIDASCSVRTKGMEYCVNTVTSTPCTLANNQAFIKWCSGAGGVLTLPTSPSVGEVHIVTNATTSYIVCVCSASTIFKAGASVNCVRVTNRASHTYIWNGSQWQVIAVG